MSPPSGAVQSLHRRPNTWISSESELRLPEFMWVPLLWHNTASSDLPVRFTCLVELSAQTLTCSLCCSGRWPSQGATVNGDWRGKDLGECALPEGCSPFLCIPPPHTHNSRLWVLYLRLPCCLSWLRIEQPCFSTERAHRILPAVHVRLLKLFIYFCWATNVLKVHLCFI